MITPIQQYSAYYFQSGRLLGISEDGITDIKILDTDEKDVTVQDFFTKDEKIYVETIEMEDVGTIEEPSIEPVTHYYEQKNGSLTEIEELPVKPEIGYSTYDSKKFTIFQDSYNNEPISKINNKTMESQATFKQIFGMLEISTGLYFNVIESRIPGRDKGLYFYPIGRKAVNFVSSALNSGFFWVNS